MRQLAWLHATPKPPPGTKRAAAKDQPPPISRMEKLTRDKIVPQMPPNPMPHIIARLLEIGLTEAAGMGSGPVSWQAIDAWCNRTGIDLLPWEAKLIRSLSVAYVAEGRNAESENCPPPWQAAVTEREREIELARLRAVLG